MKDVVDEIIGQELAPARIPVELYEVSFAGQIWYMTSSDIAWTDGYNNYNPAPIKRTKIMRTLAFKVDTCDVSISCLSPVVINFLKDRPAGEIRIKILRTYRDIVEQPTEIFSGDIMNFQIQGLSAVFKLGTKERVLKRMIPFYRVSPICNWQFGVLPCNGRSTKDGYSNATSARNAAMTQFTIPGLATYYASALPLLIGGTLWTSVMERTIVEVSGDVVTINVSANLENGTIVYTYVACDGTYEKCQLFGHPENFGGHPDLPLDNPCLWF